MIERFPLVVECQRDRIGKSPTKAALKRVEDKVSADKAFKSIVKTNGIYWLISAASTGIPLVESVVKLKGDSGPFAVIHKVSESTGSYVLALYHSPEKVLEIRFQNLESLHVALINKLLEQTQGGGEKQLFIIDKCIVLPAEFNAVRKDISSVELNRFKELLLTQHIKLPMTLSTYVLISMGIIISVFVIAYFLMSEKNKVEAKVVADVYGEFRTGLTLRGSPKAFAVQFYKDIAFTQMVLGWNAETVNVEGETVAIEFSKSGDTGRTIDLVSIAGNTGRTVANIGRERVAVISQHMPLPALSEAVQLSIESLQGYLIQAFDDWASTPETQVLFGEMTDKNQYDIQSMDVVVAGYYGDDFDTLGTLLNGLPIVFERATLTFNDGSLSGKLSFSIYGCQQKKIDSGICK